MRVAWPAACEPARLGKASVGVMPPVCLRLVFSGGAWIERAIGQAANQASLALKAVHAQCRLT